jgi:hypothetical protein
VIKSQWAIGVIAAMLLSAGAHRARAQQQKDDPPPPINEQSADWERAAEGLKKAKPIPEPSHPVTPREVTPSGGLQRFDPKTGRVTQEPASTKAAAPAKRHKRSEGCTQPKNATGSKLSDR